MAYKIQTFKKIEKHGGDVAYKIIIKDITKACEIAKVPVDTIDVDFHWCKSGTDIKIRTKTPVSDNQKWYVKNLIADSFLKIRDCTNKKIVINIPYELPPIVIM